MSPLQRTTPSLKLGPVEFRTVGDIAEVGTGSSDRKDGVDGGLYPFYVRSKNVLRTDDYEFDEVAIVIPGEGGIGDIFHFASGKYALHQRAYRIHFKARDVEPKFAFHYFSAFFKKFILERAVGATATSIRKPMISDFPVPVPPIEFQREVATFLDELTAQHDALLELLQAEHEVRRTQHGALRSRILNDVPDSLAMKVSDALVSVSAPRGIPRQRYSDGTSFPIVDQGQGLVVGFTDDADAVVRGGPFILFGDHTRQVKWVDFDFALGADGVRLFRAHEVLNARFLYHAIKALDIPSRGYNRHWTVLRDLEIRTPSLPEQARIADELDQLDALTSDLLAHLAAEITTRRKQYEYYRDKLLTFEEAPA